MKEKKLYYDKREIPLFIKVSDVARILNISRTFAYELIRMPDFPAITVGGRKRVIPRDQFFAWLEKSSKKKNV